MNLYIKTHGVSNYVIKINIKNLPPVTMFGGLAERLLKLRISAANYRTYSKIDMVFKFISKLFKF